MVTIQIKDEDWTVAVKPLDLSYEGDRWPSLINPTAHSITVSGVGGTEAVGDRVAEAVAIASCDRFALVVQQRCQGQVELPAACFRCRMNCPVKIGLPRLSNQADRSA